MEVGLLVGAMPRVDTSALVDFIRGISARTNIRPTVPTMQDYKAKAVSSIVARIHRRGDISEAQQAFIALVDEDAPAIYAAKLALLDDAPEPEVWAFEVVQPEFVVDAFKAGLHISTLRCETIEHVPRAGIKESTEEMVYYARLRRITRIVDRLARGVELSDGDISFCRLLGRGDLDYKYSCAAGVSDGV